MLKKFRITSIFIIILFICSSGIVLASSDKDKHRSPTSVYPFAAFLPIWVAVWISMPQYPVKIVANYCSRSDDTETKRTKIQPYLTDAFIQSENFNALLLWSPGKIKKITRRKDGKREQVYLICNNERKYIFLLSKKVSGEKGKKTYWLISDFYEMNTND